MTWRLVVKQTGYGLKSISRNPRALVFTVLFPVVMLVLFNVDLHQAATPRLNFQGTQIDDRRLLHRRDHRLRDHDVLLQHAGHRPHHRARERPAQAPARDAGARLDVHRRAVLRSIVLVAVMVVVLLLIGHFAFDVPIPGTRMVGS